MKGEQLFLTVAAAVFFGGLALTIFLAWWPGFIVIGTLAALALLLIRSRTARGLVATGVFVASLVGFNVYLHNQREAAKVVPDEARRAIADMANCLDQPKGTPGCEAADRVRQKWADHENRADKP